MRNITERTEVKRIGSEIFYTDENGVNQPLPDDKIVSMNFWGFTPAFFKDLRASFEKFISLHGHNLKSELYIPTALSEMIEQQKGTVEVLSSAAEWFGVTYKEDRPFVVDRLKKLTEQGEYPSPLW